MKGFFFNEIVLRISETQIFFLLRLPLYPSCLFLSTTPMSTLPTSIPKLLQEDLAGTQKECQMSPQQLREDHISEHRKIQS